MHTPIYLDYQATTPVDPRVLETMLPYFCDRFGNAASRNHAFGWTAEAAVAEARLHIAGLIGTAPEALVFTSGATEANNLAIKGVALAYETRGRRIVTVATEHSSVIDACMYLKRRGFDVVFLPVDSAGRIDLDLLESQLNDETILVSVMTANNEIGTLHPVNRIGALCRSRGILFHTDATQTAGRIPLDVMEMSADLLSLSAHKMYGPKGVGCLYVRRGSPIVHLEPQLHGGGHEHGIRSGTLNVPAIVGFGTAATISSSEREGESERIHGLALKLLEQLRSSIEGIHLNGDENERLPGNLNLRVDGIRADDLIRRIRPVAVSTGSACGSGNSGPSHVLKAIGLTKEQADGSFRLSVGRQTTPGEIASVLGLIVDAVRALRE